MNALSEDLRRGYKRHRSNSYTLLTLKYEEKLAKRAHIKLIASNFAHDFECGLQRANALAQIPGTKGSVLVVMECKRASVIYVYELIFLLQGQQSIVRRL